MKYWNPTNWFSRYFSPPVVYNISASRESFCLGEIRAIYKTYFVTGMIPRKTDAYLAVYFVMCCEDNFVDAEQLLNKIERYSKWNEFTQTLCNSISSHSNSKQT
jgi:hypothetical protein